MSISSSMANALSGLTAAAKRAEIVSSNVANAMTGGYARRELNLSSRTLGGSGAGVAVDGVSRIVDRVVLADRRLADAEAGNAAVRAGFLARIETLIGLPEDDASLSGRLARFEAALVEAASRPDSEARLSNVLETAKGITAHLNTLSAEIQAARSGADAAIAAGVAELNDALGRIDRLNAEILAHRSSGRDAAALMDQRQQLVDRVAAIVPVREVARDRDQIALFTTGGAVLLEGNPATIGFTGVGVITADMSQASGALSGLTINGQPVASADGGALGGGRLGALFALRDELAVTAQGQIDALARDLIERFEAAGVDPTRAPGQAALFSDAGAVLDPALEAGLAGRLAISAAADPARGGALWRLRDGLGAAATGPVGQAAQLNRLADALNAQQAPASSGFAGAARSASGLAADLLSRVSGARQLAEDRQGFAAARQEALTALQLQGGVDTDQELQTLLLVEKAYSANARVIQTLDALIQQIIGL